MDPQNPPHNPPRWAADPTGRHQYRYWDGTDWTEQVSDNGAVSTDPPVADVPPVPAVPVAPVAPVVPAVPVAPEAPVEPVIPTASEAPVVAPGSPPPPPGVWAPPTAGYASTPPASPAAPAAPGVAPTDPWYPNRDSTSVLGRRYGAFFIDLVICLVVFIALFAAFATQRTPAETVQLPGCHYTSSFSGDSRMVECDNRAVFQINNTVYEGEFGPTFGLFLLFTILYFALPEAIAGASLGKLMTGIRVVRADGDHIGFGRSMLRWLLWWVDGPITLFLCGIITSSTSRGHRRVGDMAADSYVVAKADAGQPVVLPPGR